MTVYRNASNNTWEVNASYKDWKGEQKRKHKRGFTTKAEALEWKREFLCRYADNLTMPFASFYEVYIEDKTPRLRLSTRLQKETLITTKILPHFGNRLINEITPKDVLHWQNELLRFKSESGKPYSQTYLRTIHNQLAAIFNHACRFYNLKENPATKAGSIGKKNAATINFWTHNEYCKFALAVTGEPDYFYSFEVLYWTGIRLGELLALTVSDIDFKEGTININKSYQRLQGKDVITAPKTYKSNRIITIPEKLCLGLNRYVDNQANIDTESRIFSSSKSKLSSYLKTTTKAIGIKPICIHEFRHSHASLLIELGYPLMAIADRLGHENVITTYRYAHLLPNKQAEIALQLNCKMSTMSNME